jgi:hypothetical protein
MRMNYQFDGISGGSLTISECTEPEQIAIYAEHDGNCIKIRLSREEWRELIRLDYKINFVYEEKEDEQKLKVVQ